MPRSSLAVALFFVTLYETPAAAQEVDEKDEFVMPKAVQFVRPDPWEVQQEGVVLLQAIIREDGKVDPSSVKALTSFDSGAERAAVNALLASEFSPATYQGKPVRAALRIPYTFIQPGAYIPRGRPVIKDAPPFLVFMPRPTLPDELKDRRIDGNGALRVTITEEGDVDPASIEVVESLEPLLDHAAVEAVRDAKFQPAVKEAKHVRITIRLPYTYDMFDLAPREFP